VAASGVGTGEGVIGACAIRRPATQPMVKAAMAVIKKPSFGMVAQVCGSIAEGYKGVIDLLVSIDIGRADSREPSPPRDMDSPSNMYFGSGQPVHVMFPKDILDPVFREVVFDEDHAFFRASRNSAKALNERRP
jgi:hypothetical protein